LNAKYIKGLLDIIGPWIRRTRASKKKCESVKSLKSEPEKCRNQIKGMLEIGQSPIDIMIICLQDFNLTYEDVKKILLEEVKKNVKCD